MTVVIKPNDISVRTIRSLDAARPALRATTIDPLTQECDRLRGQVAHLRDRIASTSADADVAIADARETGYAAGLAAADRRETERVTALTTALAAQRAALDTRLDALDGLAAALARRALARLFDRPDAMAEMVVGTLARNVAMLRSQAATSVTVSGADFPSSEPIAGVIGGSIAVAIDDGLAPGACRVACRLGAIDLDVGGQWGQVADALDRMAAEA